MGGRAESLSPLHGRATRGWPACRRPQRAAGRRWPRSCSASARPGDAAAGARRRRARTLTRARRRRPARAAPHQPGAQRRRRRRWRPAAACAWAGRADGAWVEIRVDDDGPGLPATANLFVPVLHHQAAGLRHRPRAEPPDRRGARRHAEPGDRAPTGRAAAPGCSCRAPDGRPPILGAPDERAHPRQARSRAAHHRADDRRRPRVPAGPHRVLRPGRRAAGAGLLRARPRGAGALVRTRRGCRCWMPTASSTWRAPRCWVRVWLIGARPRPQRVGPARRWTRPARCWPA